jgi:anti-sigma28 factor (negative regulator of flagellin synthesis)
VKINESDVLNIQKPQSDKVFEAVKTTRDSGLKRSSTTAPADGIDLGSQSGLLALAQQAGSSESDSRVQELRALVQSGQYQVDTHALSSAIVSAAIAGS